MESKKVTCQAVPCRSRESKLQFAGSNSDHEHFNVLPLPQKQEKNAAIFMHQSHNIPWHLIEANFEFIHDDKRHIPPRSGLAFKYRSQAAKEFKHFINKFVETIQAFSETERKKYPARLEPMITGNVFSDELLEKYPQYLSKLTQSIEYWFDRFTLDMTDYGELMDEVNVLLTENEMGTLLMLAQHPKIRMQRLNYHCWGGVHYGFCRAQGDALASYLYFNSAEAIGTIEKGEYALDYSYILLLYQLTSPMNYSAHKIPHHRFFRLEPDARGTGPGNTIVHTDYGRFQQHSKDLFALMYRYDVLAKECGIDPKWEGEIAFCYPLGGHVETKWDEHNYKWILV